MIEKMQQDENDVTIQKDVTRPKMTSQDKNEAT